MGTILERIARTKRAEVEQAKCSRPPEVLRQALATASEARDFYSAVTGGGDVRLIAEIKRSSPSAGLIRAAFDPVDIARTYQGAGAAALSVLTDRTYFGGELGHIEMVKRAVALPVLRKDFIIDEYQILESRAGGADAVLLIAALLSPSEIESLSAQALALGMCSLIEVHDLRELSAMRNLIGPQRRTILGINNRDLGRQRVDLETTCRLEKELPPGLPFVAESGIHTRADVLRLVGAGAKALLIGEALLRSPDIAGKVRELMGHEPRR